MQIKSWSVATWQPLCDALLHQSITGLLIGPADRPGLAVSAVFDPWHLPWPARPHAGMHGGAAWHWLLDIDGRSGQPAVFRSRQVCTRPHVGKEDVWCALCEHSLMLPDRHDQQPAIPNTPLGLLAPPQERTC